MGEATGNVEYVLFAGNTSGSMGMYDSMFGYLRSLSRRKLIGGKITRTDVWSRGDLERHSLADENALNALSNIVDTDSVPPPSEGEHSLFYVLRARVRDRPEVEKEAPLFCQEYKGMHWRIYESAPDPLDFDVEDQD